MKQQGKGHPTDSQKGGPIPLPVKRDVLLRILDQCDELLSTVRRLGDFIDNKIREEIDLREACKDYSVDEMVSKVSGWGIAPYNFGYRFNELTDQLHDRLQTIRPYISETSTPPDTNFQLLLGKIGNGNSADDVIKLRDAVVEICVIYLEYLVNLSKKADELRDRINRRLGCFSDDADGPTDLRTFRWKGEEAKLQPKPFALLEYLWPRRSITRNGQLIRQADIRDVSRHVWHEDDGKERAIASAMTQANRVFDEHAIPLRFSKNGDMIMLIISESV